MNIKTVTENHQTIAVVDSGELLITTDPQSALDLLATVKYETGCSRFALDKRAVAEELFILSSGLAGEVLQKFVNYRTKVAIFGDFSRYTSKPLKDFIYESNGGKDIFFVADEAEAVRRLGAAQ